MAKIKVIVDVDENVVKRDIGTDSLQDAIDAELGLLNDYGQGIAVESWDFADGSWIQQICTQALSQGIMAAEVEISCRFSIDGTPGQ